MLIIFLFLSINAFTVDENGLLTINENLINCENYFENRENVNKIIIGNEVTELGKNCFSQFKNVKEIEIGNSIEKLTKNEFRNLKHLEKITIGKNVKEIDFEIFEESYNLKEIIIENENLNYKSENNIIYDKNMNKLLYFPKGIKK